MEEHKVKILGIEPLTPDVKRFTVEKPIGYSFIPGQATEVSVNSPLLRDEKRPFSFTSLTSATNLEFTIKIYNSRKGITNEIGKLTAGDELILRDVWGAITYKGKGVFIAGGAGVTPFISIFRDLNRKNEISGNLLIFANKTRADIILRDEFERMLGDSFINILSDEKSDQYYHGMIDQGFLKTHIQGYLPNFYICGPPPMVDAILMYLENLGFEKNSITIEL